MRGMGALVATVAVLAIGLGRFVPARRSSPVEARIAPTSESHEESAAFETDVAQAPVPARETTRPPSDKGDISEPPRGESTPPENETLVRVRELEAAVDRGDTSALPRLRARSLRDNPEVAAPLIRAIGHLAGIAPSEEKRASAETLAGWLSHEMTEGSSFARGNVSLLLDALADTGSPSAVLPLVRALDAGTLPLHQATKAVEALGALGDPRGAEAVTRFEQALDRVPPDAADAPDSHLRDEARAAARLALAQLTPG